MLSQATFQQKILAVTLTMLSLAAQPSLMAASKPDDGQGQRLRAEAHKLIRGFDAELRGDFRSGNGDRRLQGELDNINAPRGTEISFCLATSNGEVPLALKQISRNDDDQRSVEFELESQNGDVVPNVVVGDSLEARHGGNNGQADCSAPLIITAKFRRH